MIPKDSIETAYSFFHQKWQVYRYSTMQWQKEDIEYAISSYVDGMNKELYALLARGRESFLQPSETFASEMDEAVHQLEKMMNGVTTWVLIPSIVTPSHAAMSFLGIKNIGKHGWCFPTNLATKMLLWIAVCQLTSMNIFDNSSLLAWRICADLPLAVNTSKIRRVCISLSHSGLRFSRTISTLHGKFFEGQKHCINSHICMLLRVKVMQIGDQSGAV